MINLNQACQLWCKSCNARTVKDPLDVKSALLLLSAHNAIKDIIESHAFNHSISLSIDYDLAKFITEHGGHLICCVGLNGREINCTGVKQLLLNNNGLYLAVRNVDERDESFKIQTIIEKEVFTVDEYETLSILNVGLIKDFIILDVINDGYLIEPKGSYQWLKSM